MLSKFEFKPYPYVVSQRVTWKMGYFDNLDNLLQRNMDWVHFHSSVCTSQWAANAMEIFLAESSGLGVVNCSCCLSQELSRDSLDMPGYWSSTLSGGGY